MNEICDGRRAWHYDLSQRASRLRIGTPTNPKSVALRVRLEAIRPASLERGSWQKCHQ